MILSHCWCLYLAVVKFLFLFWNVILYEFLHSESSPLLHILIDAFPLPQVIFILKLFIDGCTLGAKSYCTNQFLADILISGTLVVTGVKKLHLLRWNPNVLSYHVVASVTCQLLWYELLELERTLICFWCDGISYAFSIFMRCLLHQQQLLVMAMFPLLFLKSVSIL